MAKRDKNDHQLLVEANLVLDEVVVEDGPSYYQISGDTHPFRNILREAGGRWNPEEKVWVFKDASPAIPIAKQLRSEPKLIEKAKQEKTKKPHYHGHRGRLRTRFLEAGASNLPDYELLELILFQCIPRIDVKPLAKQLLDVFGSLGAVIAADPGRLGEFDTLNHAALVHLKSLHELTQRVAHEEIADQPLLGSWDKLITYLKTALAHETKEQFHVLFLNTKNVLIADEVQQTGTVNHTPVYPREVIKRALELGATALIIVHNHPSGDPSPSRADIDMTREIAEAGVKLDIVLHDHIIISKGGHTSFKDLGHL